MLNYQTILDDRKITIAKEMADISARKWADKEGNYDNTFHNHLVGRIGEIGVAQIFHESGLDFIPYFLNDEDEELCDISSRNINFEIKNWTSDLWRKYGRAVAVNQYNRVADKADYIIWCSWDGKNSEFRIRGCSKPREMRQVEARWTGPVGGRQIHNYQLEEWMVRPPNHLSDALNIPSGAERLVPMVYRVLQKAYAIEVLGAYSGNAKIKWLSENMSVTSYLPCGNIDSGKYSLEGLAWDKFADIVQVDSNLKIEFSDDKSSIIFSTDDFKANVQVIKHLIDGRNPVEQYNIETTLTQPGEKS